MAVTAVQRAKLLSKTCPWCRAMAGEECSTGRVGNRVPITTLDGGCHDARWQIVFGVPAPVVMPDEHGRRRIVEQVTRPEHEPVSVGTALAERPW